MTQIVNKTPLINTDGITIRELKEYLDTWPEYTEDGTQNRVYVITSSIRTFPVVKIGRLNQSDLIMAPSQAVINSITQGAVVEEDYSA